MTYEECCAAYFVEPQPKPAFIAAGGTGEAAVDTFMYRPVRYASAVDPFGTVIVITSPQPRQHGPDVAIASTFLYICASGS